MHDSISREAALKAVRLLQTYKLSEGDDMLLVDKADVQTELMMLPSAQPKSYREGYQAGFKDAQPKRKTGKWTKISPASIYECSVCGQTVMTDDIEAYSYCHGCGVEMEVSE